MYTIHVLSVRVGCFSMQEAAGNVAVHFFCFFCYAIPVAWGFGGSLRILIFQQAVGSEVGCRKGELGERHEEQKDKLGGVWMEKGVEPGRE